MALDTPEAKAYLFELYTMTGGDTEAQVSMYAVGESLGLEKTDAGMMAENLYTQGFAELKTLSGGIGITVEGLEMLQIKAEPKPDKSFRLGKTPVLENQGQEVVEKILEELKTFMSQTKLPYPQMEEMVMDIKTIEIQMLSPKPKTEIVREVFRSLHKNVTPLGPENLAAKLNALITS